jgi:hypothetical protein
MRVVLTGLFLLFLSRAVAQIVPSSGTYTTADGNYSLSVTFKDNVLTLIEPNKTSPYQHASGNIYTFTNPKNNIAYAIEVVDEKTLSCYHPGTPDNRTKLVFTSVAAGVNKYAQLAEAYKKKMKDDPTNTQAWAFCAAAAWARAYSSEAQYRDYATKTAKSLKLIIVDKNKCPCEDAIIPEIWRDAKID